MMVSDQLAQAIMQIANCIEQETDPSSADCLLFIQSPELVLSLIDVIEALEDDVIETNNAYYSACIFALDICVAQLNAAAESGNKVAEKTLYLLMTHLAEAIRHRRHVLTFWLPVLNAFYDAHAELSPVLKDAYFELASDEDELESDDISFHLGSIRELLVELSGLSVFDIAENFFAQSYAMPPMFFADLIVDLYSVEEGHEVALLGLLHPKQEVRDIVVETLASILPSIQLSSEALTRLQVIKQWYPPSYHAQFDHWIKEQRMRGVVFLPQPTLSHMRLRASEIDGSGAQGVFVEIKGRNKNRLCGALVRQQFGFKDVWVTPVIPAKELHRYHNEAFDESISLREIDLSYFLLMMNHFLAVTQAHGLMPDLHLLEMQEVLGVHFIPQKLDISALFDELSIQIHPFTQEVIDTALKQSKHWLKNKRFAGSWYVEHVEIDKWVNLASSFVDGVKVCRVDEAKTLLFEHEFEPHRDWWLFHFLWVSLWLKSCARKNEKTWQTSFLIAHLIRTGVPLQDIPVMHEICTQSIANSIETMGARRSHLSQISS